MATPDEARRGRGWRLVGGRQVPFLKRSWGEVRLLAEAAEAQGFARRGRAAGCSDGGPGVCKGTTQMRERMFKRCITGGGGTARRSSLLYRLTRRLPPANRQFSDIHVAKP